MLAVYVASGGAIGALLRYSIYHFFSHVLNMHGAFATFAVNVVGSFLMGLLAAYLSKYSQQSGILHPLIAMGMLGGFTTFSAFSMDILKLLEQGQMFHAFIYVLGSVVLSLLMLWIGFNIIKT